MSIHADFIFKWISKGKSNIFSLEVPEFENNMMVKPPFNMNLALFGKEVPY